MNIQNPYTPTHVCDSTHVIVYTAKFSFLALTSYSHTPTHTLTSQHTHANTQTHTHTSIHTHTHANTHTHVLYTHTHTHTHLNQYTHTYTHTHTLRRDIGLEKFFKKSFLNTVKRKNIRTMVVNTFQHYESLSMEGCIFQFFNLLTKSSQVDMERFHNCAVGVSPGMDGKWTVCVHIHSHFYDASEHFFCAVCMKYSE